MFCPYCGKNISEGLQYCPECGQAVYTASEKKYSDSNSYWSNLANNNRRLDEAIIEKETNIVKERRSKTAKIIAILITVTLAIALIIIIVNNTNKNNQALLPGYYASMVGETYIDDDSGTYLFAGQSTPTTIAKIIDEETLTIQTGKRHFTTKSSGGITWVNESMSNPETRNYKLDIDLSGNVTITIDGHKYKTEAENGKVKSISFY